jgi:tricorn protease
MSFRQAQRPTGSYETASLYFKITLWSDIFLYFSPANLTLKKMKKLYCFVLMTLLVSMITFAAAAQQAYFISDPAVSPDGSTIVFVYENDLWKVPVAGGTAYRLTALEGQVSVPRFSPDGRWIAFTSTRDRNSNVHVMPAEGGEIRQLTWHQAGDYVDSWSWDSEHIYFHSERESMSSVYRVSVEGGTPTPLFGFNYFNVEHHLVEHPVTGAYIFTESWESLRFPERKRYRGEHRPDILSYNPQTDVFENLTDYEGQDLWPTIDRQGNLYFASDEWNGEYNLYTFREGVKTRLTEFDRSIRRPQASAEGGIVAFEKDYQLFIFDVNTGESSAVDIQLFQAPNLAREQSFSVKGNITSFDVSPDEKKIAFISRGEIFVSDMDGKFIRQMPIDPTERALEVKWMKDSKTLLYTRTHNGWANLFTISADGRGAEKQLENVSQTSRLLALSPDREKAVYLSGRKQVKLADLKNLTTKVLVEDELWGFQNSAPTFSPNGEYVLFTAFRNFEQDVFIHHVKTGETTNLTHSGVSQRQPWWSPCGRYIYFSTDRVTPNYPTGNTRNSIYRIALHRFQEPFRKEKFDELFSEAKKNDTLPPVITIDMNRIEERWEQMQVRGGVQWSPQIYKQKDGQVMFFISNHDKGEMALWKMELKPFEDRKTERIQGPNPGMSPSIVNVKDNFWVLAGGNIHKLNTGSNKMDAIDMDYTFSRRLDKEFRQVFHETWTTLEENFYDEDFHGVDWHATLRHYEQFLPYLRTRDNLRLLLNDMLGELNASHMGFSSTGKEEEPYFKGETAETGIIFRTDEPFTVERIITASNLDLSNPLVNSGDVLLAVNGRRVDQQKNRDEYFYFASRPEELELIFQRGNREFTVLTRPHTPGQISNLLYDEWIRSNREYVREKSEGRIAYVYMKNMSGQALEQFLIDMTTYAERKDALLFDIRFNRGGNVHDDVLQFLSQRPYLMWKYRGGKLAPQPNFAPSAKPMVLAINERSLSDAEMTAEGFRQLDLGKIIGVETYRWIIFTSGKSFVDGSFCRLPSWGCYTLDGKNMELTGVAPDIVVYENFHDRLHGRQPQLDRAIEELLKQL